MQTAILIKLIGQPFLPRDATQSAVMPQ